jgi:hypothetical protein
MANNKQQGLDRHSKYNGLPLNPVEQSISTCQWEEIRHKNHEDFVCFAVSSPYLCSGNLLEPAEIIDDSKSDSGNWDSKALERCSTQGNEDTVNSTTLSIPISSINVMSWLTTIKTPR